MLLFFINLDCAPHRSASLFYAFRISIVAEKSILDDCHPGSTRHIAGEFGVPDLDGNSVGGKRGFDNLDFIVSFENITTQAQPSKTVTTQHGLEMEILDATKAHKWYGS